ncbi:uncharacterized protein LOC127809145 [Diospyros lotus]|uniref:uncharacterized protein LOC127809145 n=1 Tax=Diospyros lotus TaxID=55363 RepID=UPI0022565609|nr:uncharacterized protein LOC127809145 [Diospyros lotus]
MSTSGRQDRRRRIAERGQDRLALITGRIQTLPPPSSPPPPESHHSHTASCPPVIAQSTDELLFQPIVSTDDHKAPRSLARQTACVGESVGVNENEDGNVAGPILRKCETSIEASRVPSQEVEHGEQSSDTVPLVQEDSLKSTPVRDNQLEPKVHRHKFFTSNKISSAIAASARIRTYCSVAAAVLAVLSYVGFPILGSRIIKSTIFFRPFYLVLITNVSIVVARLLLDKERGSEKTKQEANNGEANNESSPGADGFVDQVGKALETGLLLQNIMGSIFMDFSIYAIIVICGISMAKTVGW